MQKFLGYGMRKKDTGSNSCSLPDFLRCGEKRGQMSISADVYVEEGVRNEEGTVTLC